MKYSASTESKYGLPVYSIAKCESYLQNFVQFMMRISNVSIWYSYFNI